MLRFFRDGWSMHNTTGQLVIVLEFDRRLPLRSTTGSNGCDNTGMGFKTMSASQQDDRTGLLLFEFGYVSSITV